MNADFDICKNVYDEYHKLIFNNENIKIIRNEGVFPVSYMNIVDSNSFIKILNDLYACHIFESFDSDEKICKILRSIMINKESTSIEDLMVENFGKKIEIKSFINFYKMENDFDLEFESENFSSYNTTQNTRDVELTSEIKESMNEFKEIYSDDSLINNKEIFEKIG
jgi:hypothetical protein